MIAPLSDMFSSFHLFISLPLLLKIITFVFSMFTFNFQLSEYPAKISICLCRPFLVFDKSDKSSAHNIQGIFVFEKAGLSIIDDFCNSSEQSSFIYRLKKKGLGGSPCFNPTETIKGSDNRLFIFTCLIINSRFYH